MHSHKHSSAIAATNKWVAHRIDAACNVRGAVNDVDVSKIRAELRAEALTILRREGLGALIASTPNH